MIDKVRDEATSRCERETTDSYVFSLALIQMYAVSDAAHFISELNEHVKKYDGHAPPDVVVPVGRRLYVFMYGDEQRTADTLTKFFGSPFLRGKPVSAKEDELGYDVGVGFSQHTPGKSLKEMVLQARNRSVRFMKLSRKDEEQQLESTSRLEYLTKVG